MIEIKITTETTAEMHKELTTLLFGAGRVAAAPIVAQEIPVAQTQQEERPVEAKPVEEAPVEEKKRTRAPRTTKTTKSVEEATAEETAAEETAAEESGEKVPTFEDLRKLLNVVGADLSKAKKAKEIFVKYKVPNVQKLPAEDIPAFYKELSAL